MASISKGWSTSFIYEQDLTSYYMNSLLRTVIRPGVYNANMAIEYTEPTIGYKPPSGKGLCLVIKKGTTFVFSNDYITYDSLGRRRNFNHSDSNYSNSKLTADENSCIMKSVALSDLAVLIGEDVEKGIYALHAYIQYNPKDTDIARTTSPTFFLAKENADNNSLRLFDIYKDTRYPSEVGSPSRIPISDQKRVLLDGTTDDDKSQPLNFYLNLGFIEVDNNEKPKMFTGRGLPEYRYSAFVDTDTLLPDIIPSMVSNSNRNNLFIDIPESLIGNTIFSKKVVSLNGTDYTNWEAAYILKRKSSEDADIRDLSNGVHAIYALASNIESFSTKQTSAISVSSLTDKTLTFGSVPLDGVDFSIANNPTYWPTSKELFPIVPLDVSPLNVKSLMSSLVGKDIWSYIIDKVRVSLTNGDSVLPTDIIPIAIVTVDDNEIDHTRTLSYLGLQDRMAKINVLNVREHNIFNVIPVIE